MGLPSLPVELRITRFDPAQRDAYGRYLPEDWTSWSDIGRTFGGRTLDLPTYRRVEDAYARAAVAIWEACGSPPLHARGVEARDPIPGLVEIGLDAPCALVEGQLVQTPAEVDRITRDCLRESSWCALEAPRSYLHFGWDLYMYVGCPLWPEQALAEAEASGLFVERHRSPYHRTR